MMERISFYQRGNVLSNEVVREKKFTIYSKDTGYDPLIHHLKKSGIKVKRIVSFQELSQNKVIKIDEAGLKKVKESLLKTAANKRPKKRSSLIGHIRAQLKALSRHDVDKIIEDLFIKKVVYEENGLIKYSLDKG